MMSHEAERGLLKLIEKLFAVFNFVNKLKVIIYYHVLVIMRTIITNSDFHFFFDRIYAIKIFNVIDNIENSRPL